MRMAELTEKDKKLLNCLFQALLNKGKAKSIIEVKKAVDEVVTSMNGLMQFDGAMFQYAKDNGVEKEFQDKIMESEINLKNEENEEIKEIELKPMENVTITNQKEEETEIQTYDLSKIPTTKDQLDAKRAEHTEKLIIEGDAVIKKVALEIGKDDQQTQTGKVYRDYLLALTFEGCNGEGEVIERYGGVTGWLNNGILSEPSFDSSRNTKVAKIFKQFAKAQKINTDEIETGLHLGLLIKFLQSKPKVLLVDGSGSFTNAKGQEIKYKKNDIAKFY